MRNLSTSLLALTLVALAEPAGAAPGQAAKGPQVSPPAAKSAPRSADPRTEALTAWLEGYFPWGAGEMTIEDVPQARVAGYRCVRAKKQYAADARMVDSTYLLLTDDGKTAIAGDLFADEDRMKAPAPIRVDSDLETVRGKLRNFFRGSFRVVLDPTQDRPGLRGLKILADTGYGSYDIGGFISAADGVVTIVGRAWDRNRSVPEQRRAMIKLNGVPVQGPDTARVAVVEYSDMQCPYCKKRTGDWETLKEKLGKELKIKRYIKLFPLTNDHPWAFRAASAGRCFFEVDPKLFFRWKSMVYAKQEELNVAALDAFALDFAVANEVGENGFKNCYLQARSNAKVLEDLAEGFAVRVRSAPTYFFDGVPVSWFADGLMEEFLRKTYLKGAGLPAATPATRAAPKPASKK